MSYRNTTLFRYIGGILLVAGTTIGAGMLALPVSTAFMGFYPSLLIFFVCWAVMLVSAYFFLDVNFSLKGEVNLISMAHRTLGTWGKALSWVIYLLLLYSLLAAYIAGSAPLFKAFFQTCFATTLPDWLALFMLPLLFGGAIYLGTLGVDWINKLLMLGLIISYGMLVAYIPPHIEISLLNHVDWSQSWVAISVIITSFGYHIIIPSLTTYMNHDRKHLTHTLLIGSITALIVYVLWQIVVLGSVPLGGEYGLTKAWLKGVSATTPLSHFVDSVWIHRGAFAFSFFAIVTSFLGVSLSLSDFLTDGLKLKKTWEGKLFACLLTFIPPIVFVFTSQRGFILALEYAGAFVAILLIFLPAMMAWHLKTPKFYTTMKAKVLIIGVIIFACVIVLLNGLQQLGYLNSILQKYLSNV